MTFVSFKTLQVWVIVNMTQYLKPEFAIVTQNGLVMTVVSRVSMEPTTEMVYVHVTVLVIQVRFLHIHVDTCRTFLQLSSPA